MLSGGVYICSHGDKTIREDGTIASSNYNNNRCDIITNDANRIVHHKALLQIGSDKSTYKLSRYQCLDILVSVYVYYLQEIGY